MEVAIWKLESQGMQEACLPPYSPPEMCVGSGLASRRFL